jgi:hypothetical protein
MTLEEKKEHLALAFEFLEVAESEKNMEQGLEIGISSLSKKFSGAFAATFGPQELVRFDEMVQDIRVKFKAEFPSIIAQGAATLTDIFTLEELREVLPFYKSGVGKLLVSKMPAFQQRMALIGGELSQRIAQEILTKMETLSSKASA